MTFVKIMPWMPQKKIVVATEILIFDFELFIGDIDNSDAYTMNRNYILFSSTRDCGK